MAKAQANTRASFRMPVAGAHAGIRAWHCPECWGQSIHGYQGIALPWTPKARAQVDHLPERLHCGHSY